MLYLLSTQADVAESADATDLKSVGKKFPYRFKSGHRHQYAVVHTDTWIDLRIPIDYGEG